MEREQIEILYQLAKSFLESEPEDILTTLDESAPLIASFCPTCALWLWKAEKEQKGATCYWRYPRNEAGPSRGFGTLCALFSQEEKGKESETDPSELRILFEGENQIRVLIPLKNRRGGYGLLEILIDETNVVEESHLRAFYQELAPLFSGILPLLGENNPDPLDPSQSAFPGIPWETGTDGCYRYVDPKVYEWYGYRPEEMIGKPRDEFIDQFQSVSAIDRNPSIAPISKETRSHVIRVKGKEGVWQQVFTSLMPFYDDSGEWRGYRGIDQIYPDPSEKVPYPSVNQDLERRVAERTQAFQRMIERYKTVQMRLEMVLWAANQGIWDWDLQSDTIYHNENYYTLLGYSKRDFTDPNKVWRQLIHPEDLDRALKALEDHYSGLKPYYEVEYRMKKKNGEYLWILDKGRIVSYGEDLIPLRMVGIHSDITERRAFEEELRRAKEIAENASRSKSEFIANVNHELRTPLTVIMGIAETILMEIPIEKKEFPIRILKNAKHLLNLINDIIDLSKIESGKFALVKKPFQLTETMDFIRQSFALETERKGLYLKIAAPSIGLVGDHVRLKQILTNLVANAIKFTSRGGITLFCAISTEEDHAVLSFEIQDTGIGIAESELDKIFERFYQIDGSNHRKYSGTGLGLSIVKQLVDLMNGSVWVRSQIGKGTTFFVRIPFRLPDRPRETSAHATSQEAL